MMKVKTNHTSPRVKSNFSILDKKWNGHFFHFKLNDLTWILIIAAIFRLFYYSLIEISEFHDSISYLYFSANIFLGEVNDLRTPLYPYFIKFIRIFGEQNLFSHIFIAQSIISFLTIVLFYKIAGAVLKNRAVIITATLLYGMSPALLNWDKCILTESLAISAIVGFLYLFVNYLKNPTILKAFFFTLLIFLMIMLRPSFIILLPIMMLFWILRILFIRKNWKMGITGLAASFLCILLIMGYSKMNYQTNGSKSISVVSSNNFLDIIIENKIYMNGNDPEVSETIKNNLAEQNGEWDYEMILGLYAQFSHERMSKFISRSLINQPTAFIKRTFNSIISVKNSKIVAYYAKKKDGFYGFLHNMVAPFISIPFMAIYLLLIFDFIYIMLQWVRLKNIPWFKTILWMVVAAQFVVTFFAAQDEYQRIFVSALPYLIILFFSYIDIIIFSIDKNKIKQYYFSPH